MAESTSRRHFIIAGTGAALLGLAPGSRAEEVVPPVDSVFPRQEADAVRDVVGASHARLDRVKELVTARPALARAAWDWGFGDWETALGAASHTGNREIAEFLMSHGARPDIFTFAMLGDVDSVRSMITSQPGLQRTHGPHGITLLAHAKTGLEFAATTEDEKARAKELVDWLKSLGDADVAESGDLIEGDAAKPYLGRYDFGKGVDDYFIVELDKKGNPTVKRADQSARRLRRVEDHTFAPVGTPDVRLRFDFKDGAATTLTVHDPMPVVRAVRVE